MEENVEERNQQRDREAVEQRREKIRCDGDSHAPRVRAKERKQPAVGRHLPPRGWRQERERKDYFLGSDSAVEEGAAVPALILAQLGRVNKKAVAGGEQRVRAW